MTDPRLLPAGVRDIEGIAAFRVACWQEAYRGLLPNEFLESMDVEQRTAAWRRRIERRERDVIVAWREEAIVGVVSWAPGTLDELHTLYVAAGECGTGLAGRLLIASIAERPAGLWVFAANVRAQRFYSKHGFRSGRGTRVDEETGEQELRFVRGRVETE